MFFLNYKKLTISSKAKRKKKKKKKAFFKKKKKRQKYPNKFEKKIRKKEIKF